MEKEKYRQQSVDRERVQPHNRWLWSFRFVAAAACTRRITIPFALAPSIAMHDNNTCALYHSRYIMLNYCSKTRRTRRNSVHRRCCGHYEYSRVYRLYSTRWWIFEFYFSKYFLFPWVIDMNSIVQWNIYVVNSHGELRSRRVCEKLQNVHNKETL